MDTPISRPRNPDRAGPRPLPSATPRMRSLTERLPDAPFGHPPRLPWALLAHFPGWQEHATPWRPPADLMELHCPVLVASLWQRLLTLVHDPAVVVSHGRRRAVQVMGCARFERRSNGQWRVWLWRPSTALEPERMAWHVCPPEEVVLHGLPAGWTWLDLVRRAANAEIARNLRSCRVDLWPQEVEAYTQGLFAHFRRRLARRVDLRAMRRRVAQALRLDAEALAMARRVLRAGAYPQPRLADYNRLIAKRAAFRTLQREVPSALPLYAAWCDRPDFPRIAEPAAALVRYLRDRGLAPRTWRLVAGAGPRLLLPVRSFYRGDAGDALIDYLRILERLDLRAEPPAWFMWCLLSQVANPGYRFQSHLAFLENDLGRCALAVRHLMRLPALPVDRDEVPAVIDWLLHACPEIDPRQQRAGWGWMLRQARRAQERARRAVEAASSAWPVPIREFETEGLVCRPLGDGLALWEEGEAMRHCIVRHEAQCREGEALVVSIQEPGAAFPRRVATALLERPGGAGGWNLEAVRGFANADPSPRAMRAVEAMMAHLRGPQAAPAAWNDTLLSDWPAAWR